MSHGFVSVTTWLRWLLHPVMAMISLWETRKRLKSLRRYVAKH
jgi:hypothetical protein